MSQISSFISCPQIQGQLNEFWDTCDATRMREGVVLQPFLYSPTNSVGGSSRKMTDRVSPGGGKVRAVEFIYSPRLLESDVEESTGRDDCTSSNIIGETSTIVEVPDEYVQESFTISPMMLRERCQSNELYLAEKIMMLVDVVVRKRETVLFNTMPLLYGNFAEDEPDVVAKTKTVATRQGVGSPNLSTDALEQIGLAAEYAGYCANPIVIGGREITSYMNKLMAGCCYTEGGYDVGELLNIYGMAALPGSYRADDAFGTNGFMTVAPGAMQLVEWLEFEGPNGSLNHIEEGPYKAMVITDPRTGARFDLKITMDCNLNYSIFVRSYFKLIALPQDMFYVGDRLAGVNFVNNWTINNT